MNRNLDGSILTVEDLLRIAREHEINEEKISAAYALHNTNLIHSTLLDLTAEIRFGMYMNDELCLDTRNKFNTGDYNDTI